MGQLRFEELKKTALLLKIRKQMKICIDLERRYQWPSLSETATEADNIIIKKGLPNGK